MELERLGREMLRIYRKYNPAGDYLAVCFTEGRMEAHNKYWSDDSEYPIKMKWRYVG